MSQPTLSKTLGSKNKAQIPTLKNKKSNQNNDKGDQPSQAATNSKGKYQTANLALDSIIWSSKSGSTMNECQTIDSKKSQQSENSSIFNEEHHTVNDFNMSEAINKNQANKIQSKKPVIK